MVLELWCWSYGAGIQSLLGGCLGKNKNFEILHCVFTGLPALLYTLGSHILFIYLGW